eukprot:1089621_1
MLPLHRPRTYLLRSNGRPSEIEDEELLLTEILLGGEGETSPLSLKLHREMNKASRSVNCSSIASTSEPKLERPSPCVHGDSSTSPNSSFAVGSSNSNSTEKSGLK